MNKKMLAMVMVPVLVVMSGSLAFSAFSGFNTTTLNATSGDIGWETSLGPMYKYGTTTHVTDPSTYTGQDSTSSSVSVIDMSPGDWVELNCTIKYTGTVDAMATQVVSVSLVGQSGSCNINSGYNGSISSSYFVYGTPISITSGSSAIDGFVWSVSNIPTTPLSDGTSFVLHIWIGLNNLGDQNNLQNEEFSVTSTITFTSIP